MPDGDSHLTPSEFMQSEADSIDAAEAREARALELAKAHHAAMGPAMRKHLNPAYMVLAWEAMPEPRRECMVDVMRSLLEQGVIE